MHVDGPRTTRSKLGIRLVGAAATGFGVGALRASRPHGTDAGDAGRASRLVAPGAAVLLTLAAAIAVWQLQLYGSPITEQADDEASVDLVTALAPALALVAIVFIGLTVLPAVMRLFERLSRRSRAPRMLAGPQRLETPAAPDGLDRRARGRDGLARRRSRVSGDVGRGIRARQRLPVRR